jgi:RHS repeat-associated protein
VEPPFPAFSSNLSDARVVQQLNYTYDAVGNIVEIYDEAYEPQFFRNQMVEPRSRFVYDALYRLVEATGREGANPATAPTAQEPIPQRVTFPVTNRTLRNYTQRYAYDAVGNIRRMRHIADQGDWHRRYDYFASNNRLMRTWEGDDDWNSGNANNKVSYDYDTHGNTRNLADVSPQFYLRWDHRDMLRRIELGAGRDVRYQYDSGKQRTRKVITDGGGRAERLYLGGLELFRRFVPGNAQPVEEIESLHVFEGDQRVLLVDDVVRAPPASPLSEGQLYRYQYGNHLGSVSLELNELAATISYEEFHPYGTMAYRAVVGAIETPGKRYRYVGMERDDESALGYHGARYVAPWMSRWVSADPSGIGDGLNLYCYSACDPVNNVDVNGRAVKPKEYLALPEALRRELENPPLLPPVITPILPPEGPTMSQGGPIDPRWATPQYQQEIRERAYYESHPLEALDRSAEQMQKRDVVRFISQFGTARNMPGYQGPTTLPGNYQRGAPTHQAMPRGPAKPAPVSPMTPPEPVAPAAPYQPELPVTIAPPKAPEPPPPAPAAPSQPPKVIIPPAPPQQKLLPPGGIPSQTLNQVRNLKGTNQERGAAAKERVRQMNQGGGERVTPTRAGKRQNDVAYDQPRSQTELQHEVKNYRVWITVEGEARLHEVELTPTLRQQAERNFWWRREGLRLGEDRLVQWDFVGAPPSQELAELLQFLKIPYVIHQRQQ